MNALRDNLAVAAAEQGQLRSTLNAFEVRYDAQIGVLLVELDQIELSISSYQRRISVLVQPINTWMGEEEIISRVFRADQQRIDDEYAEASRAEERAKTLAPDPPEDIAEQIRRLYRKLARMHHPDLAVSDSERSSAEAFMKRINAAMEAKDLDALRRLEIELPQTLDEIIGETRQAQMTWMLTEIGRLEAAISGVVSTIATLKSSSVYEIWQRWQSDRGTLNRLETQIREQITNRSWELNSLIEQYRQTADSRIAEERA